MSQPSSHKNDFPIVSDHSSTAQSGAETGGFFRFSLRTTIMFWFLGISLIPVALVSLVGYDNAVSNRIDDFSVQLIKTSLLGKQNLKDRFVELEEGLKREAWNPQIIAMLSNFDQSPASHELSKEGAGALRSFQIESFVHDVLLINQAGDVVFSCAGDQTQGRNLLQDEAIDSELKSKIRLALGAGETAYSSYGKRFGQGNLSLAYHLEPVMDQDGEVGGLLIMELGVEIFAQRWNRKNIVDDGTMFYVVNENLQLLVAPTQYPGTPLLAGPISNLAMRNWQHHLQVNSQKSGMKSHFHEVQEYCGLAETEVLGVIQDLNVLGSTFALVSEIPRGGVLAGLKQMGLSLLAVIVLVGLLVVMAGLIVSTRMVDPINQLGRVMQRVTDGHEVWNLPEKGPREICQLTHMFHCMIKKLTDAQAVNERQYSQKQRQFELNEKLRGEGSLEDLSLAVLEYLGEYFGAQLGVFYLVESRNTYRVVAQFGVHEGAREMDDVILGQGVVGRVVAQKKVQVLRGFKEDRLKVETGLVRSYVNHLVVAPIHFGNRVLAVLELGLMEDVGEEKLEFLAMVSETVAVAINSARSRERVHRLLKETWSQAATLSKQQKDLRETNRRLELADQYKSEFLANMSHELRTPLNSLLIMSQVLAENRKNNLSREEVDSAMTINRAGSDLLLLINDILDLSRVEAGKLELRFSRFELKPLLKDMEDLFVPLAKKQGLDFRTIIGPGLPGFLKSDSLRMNQILKNILNNAFKFTKKGSVTFRVRTAAPGELTGLQLQDESNWLVFSVADTGVGMNNETQKHIFEAFNQGDGSIGRRYGGSGLGLSISRQLCEMLGGQIQLESIEGKGSTFRLYVPVKPSEAVLARAEADKPLLDQKFLGELGMSLEPESEVENVNEPSAQDSEAPKSPSNLNLNQRRVLVCEDDMRTVFQISEVLDELGADVTLAPSWTQGVAEGLSDHGYDFAIFSNRLADRPDANSVSAWKKECGNPIYPVLALVMEEDGLKCEGADLVGSRPLIRKQFLGLIEQALAMENAPLV